MKILWLTEFYPKDDKMIGGVQARCHYVGEVLSRSNDLQVIEGIPKKFAQASSLSFLLRLFYLPLEIVTGLKTDFDIIEASNFVMYIPAWIIGKLKQKPVVFWYPDVYIDKWVENVGPVGVIGEFVERALRLLSADHYIAISNTVKEKLISENVPPEKISVIYCGVSKKEISEVIAKTKKRDLIAVSRLVKYKKIDQLISALDPNISLTIIGSGPEEKNLKKQSGKNVTFLGSIASHKEVLKTIAESKILCHPSVVEGFGISIIEAMSLGIPVLLANTKVAKEITRNWQGALPFSVENIAELLHNKNLYSKKSKEALALSKNYLWEDIAHQTMSLYERIVKA